MPVKHLAAELPQKIQNARCVGRHEVDAHPAVLPVRLPVLELRGLFDVGDGVDAEAAHPLVQPEASRVEKRLSHLRVLPVQVRLLFCEGVEVILPPLLAPRPGRTAKNAPPVRGGASIRLRVPPDVPIRFGVRPVLLRLQEPGVLVGAVIEHEVHHDADAALLCLGHQSVEVLHRAIGRVDARVVRDVIAVVHHRRGIDRRQPHRPHAEGFEIIQLARDAGQVPRAAARGVHEALWVDLIDDGPLPPLLSFHRSLPLPYKPARGEQYTQ